VPDRVSIESEQPADHAAIRTVVAAAFAHHPEVSDMVEAIRASDRYRPELSLVARLGGRVVGHVLLSGVDLVDADRRHRVLTLSPLAVAPGLQGRGIGSALVRAAVDRADDAGEPVVVLEGSPAFYGRLGFEASVGYGITITLPSWAPAEAAQVRRLSAYDPAVRGHVEYPPAFDVALTDR
jgi:putative acetyltransferase